MKPLNKFLRTSALAVGLISASALPALAGASPAAAATAFGSGAAVQKGVQAAWLASGAWTPPSGDSITYTGTNSAAGFAELGNDTGKLDATQDTAANPVLDGYVGVDSAVTPTQAANADTAAGSGTQNELSIPVAQVSEVIELNYPSGITLNSAQNIKLTNLLAEELFAGTVPATTNYAKNTWGALFEGAKLTKITSGSPTVGQFLDSGTNGGTTKISQVLRTDGAGATLVLKQYLEAVAAAIPNSDWSGVPADSNTTAAGEWPSAATVSSRQTSDSLQASTVAGTAGLVGYGTLGAALTAGFTDTPGTGSPQNHKLFAWVQDNGVGTTGVRYADPVITAATNNGASNVYFGGSINTSGTYAPGKQSGAGNWRVPNSSGVLNKTGQWATNGTTVSDYTHGWDYNVYTDAGATADYYPLDIVLWDLSWTKASFGTGNLVSPLYPTPTGTNSVEETVASYFTYVTGTTGQSKTITPHFAPLPTGGTGLADIRADAASIAGAL